MNILLKQQQQQPQTNDQQQPDSIPLSNISNIISASTHLLPPPSTAITSALTSASTSENKPKSNAGRTLYVQCQPKKHPKKSVTN